MAEGELLATRAPLSIDRTMRQSWAVAGPLALSAAITIILYHSSLEGGFMFDDPLDLSRAIRPWSQILTSAGESSYFRPITLILWKTCYSLLGRHDPVLLHGICLGVHAFNGWLVYRLASALVDRLGGLVAMALFLSFPLSYQAVGIVNSFFHVLVTFWLLLAVNLYWSARSQPAAPRSRWLLTGAWIAGALAPFTHENGLILLGLLGLIESRFVLCCRQRPRVTWLAVFLVEVVGFLVVWMVVPRYRNPIAIDPASLGENGLYFLQALVFPLAGQIAALSDQAQSRPVFVVLSMVVVFGLGSAALVWWRPQALMAGVAWFLLSVVPTWLLLKWGYVIDGPRLLYLASVGVAIFWASALTPRLDLSTPGLQPTLRLASSGIGLAALAVVLLSSRAFIAERLEIQEEGASVVRQLVRTATDQRQPGKIYVNVPAWLAPRDQRVPFGTTGITMIPDYIGLGRSVFVHSGQQPEIISVSVPAIAQNWRRFYGFHGRAAGEPELASLIQQGGGVYVARFEDSGIALEYVGEVEGDRASVSAPLARFGDWLDLERAHAQQVGDVILLDLQWRQRQAAPGDYTVFVHLVGESPQPIVQDDGYPLGGLLPLRTGQGGEVIIDRRRISISSVQLERLQARLLIGVYDRESGARAAASDSNGKRLDDDALSIPIS